MTRKVAVMRPRMAAECTASELRTMGRPAVVSVQGATNGQVPQGNGQVHHANGQVHHANGQIPHANGQVSHAIGQVPHANGRVPNANGRVPNANGRVPHANGQVHYANGAPTQPSFAQVISKKVGIAAAVPPFSAQLQPNATAADIVQPTLAMNGVTHGVVVGATANGPCCVPPTEEGSIHDSPPLPQVPGDMLPNGICGPRQRSSDELRLQEIQKTLPSHFPRRPAQGKLGRPIQLMANHFSVEIPAGNVYHYDVEIFSENNKEAKIPEKRKYRCISTKINRLVIEQLVKKYRLDLSNCVPAFDGRKNLYTRRELKFRERTFAVEFEEDQRVQKFVVKIQYVATVNLDALHAVFENKVNTVPQEVLQAVDIVLRHGPSIRLTPVGRSFFKPPLPNQAHSLGGGREVWFGYYTSVRPAQWKPMLNVDMSATAFYEPQPVISFMCKILSDGRREMTAADFHDLRDFQNVRLNKELKGLRIKVTHLPYPRKYKVVRVTKEPAKRLLFDMEDGSRCSVADYFQNRYGRLVYPNLPCIQVGNLAHPVYLPLEVCEIVEGQHCRKKLNENQTSEMIKRTAQPPDKRFNEIRQSVRDLIGSNDQCLREFNIKISTEPTQLKGRVLEPPSLVFENNAVTKPREGTWELRGKHFFKAASLTRWTLLNLSRFAQRDSLDNFVKLLVRTGNELGMRIEQPVDISSSDTNRKPIRTTLLEEQRKVPNIEMVIIILTKSTNYAEIKQVAETEIGLRTQCVMDNNVVKKCNPALVTNLCQKMNAKLGGTNNSLLSQEKPAIFLKPIIIIGADVTHPAPGDKHRPSIAACVGSLDSIPSRFHSSIRVQMEDSTATSRVEIIRDLKDMMKELLKAFYRATKRKPERIIFYRDGVSEGQFMEVRNREVSAIRLACQEMSPNETYEPALTFIVVQKRHHTRFMPANDRDGVGKCKNVPPGTTVDSVVTHPLDFDFFLCSHFGIQGTSKPSHYYIVWDDSDFSADDLQKLSFYLCHTYARCSRSVSIPAPVYYAHLAASRAKNHVIGKVDVSSSSSDSSGASADSITTSQYVQAVKVLDNLQTAMYFV
ncbi:protein argonaute-4-like isoform X2 [Rhipicephalus microplus]|uniref:protein argonaute-4-like isoform X2 n=1 Tax=Rhipicephalus microplus TaxID=6941 RepID=UPI003F6B9098